MLIKQEIIAQIDRALRLYEDYRKRAKYDDLSDLGESVHEEVATIVAATLRRLAPDNSPYREARTLKPRIGSLKALRRDYDEGYLSSVQGLIRAELFADFLEMAEHLLEQGYKDPAAVLVGGVLEEHLRVLCIARSISISISGRPKRADAMNNELGAAEAYNKLDQKSVTAWLDLRNKAAHGEFGQYTSDQVATMLSGVREFAARVPAV
jgi:hypothetical protein